MVDQSLVGLPQNTTHDVSFSCSRIISVAWFRAASRALRRLETVGQRQNTLRLASTSNTTSMSSLATIELMQGLQRELRQRFFKLLVHEFLSCMRERISQRGGCYRQFVGLSTRWLFFLDVRFGGFSP